ncbi:phosphoglucosamine mutase [Acidiferrimicrobium sp. IK]|uniref:phosphoglucosamine mutase n=1 Tax=Acidiferrimicrobium sp. IK TaxID=2871700 RepID=UPI0021CB65D0|nr:phosphoglucosamine mutase [Acidiferrimicrobium sp. IK]MCU4186288.1 phosphoglucosamine mutase [Acidiferrimicrobium sp. IK]
MTLRFGTDGVRGVAGAELTPELVMALGRVTARGLVASVPRSFVVGRDTRRSGPMLAAALAAGLAAEGVEVIDVGVLPTPAVAALCAARGLPGAVISASHNPFADNGVKLFAAGGLKLDDATEERLEAALLAAVGGSSPHPPTAAGVVARSGADIGGVNVDPDAAEWYRHRVVGALAGRRLDGLKVALDCANGAVSGVAASAARDAGAEVVAVLGAAPDGTNINRGTGSTYPEPLGELVVAAGADLGLAFDGDADRVIAVDGMGRVVDGDRLLALFATDLRARGALADDTVVVTVMTNLGFHQAMAAAGITVHQTQVGDRYVLEALDANRWSLGGEQSGHVIFRDLATTGDGLLSGLLLADLVARSGRSLAELADGSMVRLPQVLRNVAVADRDGLPGARAVWDAVRDAERALDGRGRVLLRPSGTERLVRVMVEAPSEEEADQVALHLADAVTGALGSP